jgi:hypothetical protein
MATNTSTQYPTFKARLTMGSLFDIKTTDHKQQPEADENRHHWFQGFAVAKGSEWDAVWSAMWGAAASDPACTAALCSQPGFGWKIEDCDAPSNPENKGKASYPAGHWMIKFARYRIMGPPPVCDGAYNAIINKLAVKRGDYFIIDASTVFNGCNTIQTNAGMYQNLNGVMFAEAGAEIVSEGGFVAATAFAGVQGGMVNNGAVAQTTAPTGYAPPQTPATPQHQAPPQTPATPQAPVTPATDLVAPAGGGIAGNIAAPSTQPAPPAQPAPPELGYIVDGVSHTKASMMSVGYTEQLLAALQRG